jgi:DNA-binding NarL/FixJ family response regulator
MWWKGVAAKPTTLPRSRRMDVLPRSRRMDVDQSAKTTPSGRLLMVRRLADGWSTAQVAAAFGIMPKTVGKWQAVMLPKAKPA